MGVKGAEESLILISRFLLFLLSEDLSRINLNLQRDLNIAEQNEMKLNMENICSV